MVHQYNSCFSVTNHHNHSSSSCSNNSSSSMQSAASLESAMANAHISSTLATASPLNPLNHNLNLNHQPQQLVIPNPRRKILSLDTQGIRKLALSRGPVTPDSSTHCISSFHPNFFKTPPPSSPRVFHSRNGSGCPSPLPFAMDEDLTESGASAEECLQSACQELMEILAAPAPVFPLSPSICIDRPIRVVNRF